MELMNRYLPQYQFAEAHSRYIPATAASVLEAVSQANVVDDPIVRRLIALREFPNRLAGWLGFKSTLKDRPALGLGNFTFLGRNGDHEMAYGLAGRFWQSDYGLVKVADEHAFFALDTSGIAKLVMNFTAEAEGPGTRLTTRTRIWCGDEATRRSFRPYWFLIRPASGWIRRRMLRRAHEAALRP